MDLSYWQRRVDQLREEYRKREKFLNPTSGSPSKPSSREIEEKIEGKLKNFVQSYEFKDAVREAFQDLLSSALNAFVQSYARGDLKLSGLDDDDLES